MSHRKQPSEKTTIADFAALGNIHEIIDGLKINPSRVDELDKVISPSLY